MVGFITRVIKEQHDEHGVDAGQKKYRAYFVKLKIYEKYRSDVDSVLITDGYEDCIVAE